MDDATVGMAASEKEVASVDADAVAFVYVDAVDSADVEAEAVLPVRSDEAFPIRNNCGCSRCLLLKPGKGLFALLRQPGASTKH